MKTIFAYLVLLGILSTPLSAESITPFVPKDYTALQGMPGFSKEALELHLKLYRGYVDQTNQILTLLQAMTTPQEPIYATLKRHLMWEYDGMRLHEQYFDNLGGHGTTLDPQSSLFGALVANFGDYKRWEEDFKATGAMRGIGWAVLYRDPVSGRLVNAWINEHDKGHLAGGSPILIMDVFEHAYLPDYGLNRKAYIEAFFDNINWTLVEHRYLDETSH